MFFGKQSIDDNVKDLKEQQKTEIAKYQWITVHIGIFD